MDLFLFERGCRDTLDLFPLRVRYALDKVNVKLSKEQWERLSLEERRNLLSLAEAENYELFLKKIMRLDEGAAKMSENLESYFLTDFYLLEKSIAQKLKKHNIDERMWNVCDDFEKYCLLKLCSRKKISENFPLLAQEIKSKKLIRSESAYETILANFNHPPTCQKSVKTTLPLYLMEDVESDRDYPPFNRVMMDGIAVDSKDFHHGSDSSSKFQITEFLAAGEPPVEKRGIKTAVEVSTGAPLPKGMDCVIPYEQTVIEDSTATIESAAVKAGLNIAKQGEESRKADVLIKKGQFIKPQHYPILASVGKLKIKTFKMPKIFVISTGDELAPPSKKKLHNYQIRQSHDLMIKSMLGNIGFSEIEGVLTSDNFSKIKFHFLKALQKNSVIFFTGGMSLGKKDFVKNVLIETKCEIFFHRVSQKPGKPFLFAKKNKSLIFGLPGNPMAAAVCLRKYFVEAFMEKVFNLKTTSKVKVNFKTQKQNVTSLFKLVKKNADGDSVEIIENISSGDFIKMGESDGIIEIDPMGENILYYPWAVKLNG